MIYIEYVKKIVIKN